MHRYQSESKHKLHLRSSAGSSVCLCFSDRRVESWENPVLLFLFSFAISFSRFFCLLAPSGFTTKYGDHGPNCVRFVQGEATS